MQQLNGILVLVLFIVLSLYMNICPFFGRGDLCCNKTVISYDELNSSVDPIQAL